MLKNNSPWIEELARTRPVLAIESDMRSDVAIVGGGIAGVTTAFFTLRDTDKSVILIEADKIAHGATGHNAGQIASYFERPLPEMVEEFGLELAIDGQRSIESAWDLLELIIKEANLRLRYYRFVGHAGISSIKQLIPHLKSSRYRVDHKLFQERILVAQEWREREEIPNIFNDLFSVVPQSEILEILESDNADYIASLSYQKGCMNSALFTEELIEYLKKIYGDRFMFYEGSPVETVTLNEEDGELDVLSHKVRSGNIVLCTNGFEQFSILNKSGSKINTQFHHTVTGLIGYMAGYIQSSHHEPVAISYFPKLKINNRDVLSESYFYLTRRSHEHKEDISCDLICVGGPDKVLAEEKKFAYNQAEMGAVSTTIDQFLKRNYNKYPQENIKFDYLWQGLMGYTPNGIRRIGPEPCNEVLLYNLGCNGIGILPSIFGGKRIAQFLKGDKVAPSIFDPHDQRIT